MSGDNKLLRLALRSEGNWYVAYLAPLDTMAGAKKIATLAHAVNDERLKQFTDLMESCVADVIEKNSGIRPEIMRSIPWHEDDE